MLIVFNVTVTNMRYTYVFSIIVSLKLHIKEHLQLIITDVTRRKEGNFYLTTHSTNGIRHMVKDHSDSERGNLLPPQRLLFLISSKVSFICII